MSNVNQNSTKMVTEKVRLSYAHLYTPYAAMPGQEPKYSTTILIPKTDVATMHRIQSAIQSAIANGVQTKWNGARPANPKDPLWDGDGLRQNGEPFGEECKGHWVMTASSKLMPQVVDLELNPIIDQTQVYSGMYARVSLNFFPYSNSGNRGIGCGLGNVQKIADGEPLGGRSSAEDDFGSLPPITQVQPQYQQNTYVPPVSQPQYTNTPQTINQAPQQQYQAIDPVTGLPVSDDIPF